MLLMNEAIADPDPWHGLTTFLERMLELQAGDRGLKDLITEGALIDASRDEAPELWRRYLGIIIRGLAADPDAQPPLSPPPLAPEQVDHVMSQLKPGSRSSS